MKSAISCQSKPRLQSSAIESKHNHFNFGAPQYPGTACMKQLFLSPQWDDVSLYIQTIEEHSFESEHLFQVNIVVVRIITNVLFNGVQFTWY